MPAFPAAMTGPPVIATAFAPQRGFSLLELMVALIVVVLVTTLVNLTVSSGGQDVALRAAAYELADVAAYALDEAQMTGVDYGLLLEEEQQAGEVIYRYRWLERKVDGWGDPASGKEVFRHAQLPPGIALELELEDSPLVELSLEEDEDEKDDKPSPQVVFYASGETTPGALNIRLVEGDDLLWRIEWDLLGEFKVLPRGEAEAEEDEEP
jgi:type II secretion system protein H